MQKRQGEESQGTQKFFLQLVDHAFAPLDSAHVQLTRIKRSAQGFFEVDSDLSI